MIACCILQEIWNHRAQLAGPASWEFGGHILAAASSNNILSKERKESLEQYWGNWGVISRSLTAAGVFFFCYRPPPSRRKQNVIANMLGKLRASLFIILLSAHPFYFLLLGPPSISDIPRSSPEQWTRSWPLLLLLVARTTTAALGIYIYFSIIHDDDVLYSRSWNFLFFLLKTQYLRGNRAAIISRHLARPKVKTAQKHEMNINSDGRDSSWRVAPICPNGTKGGQNIIRDGVQGKIKRKMSREGITAAGGIHIMG